MNIYRDRPKGNYIQESSWEELYALTQHWKLDLEFYRDDMRFLQKLIDNYFIWLTKDDNVQKVSDIRASLLQLSNTCDYLLSRLTKHINQFGKLLDQPETETSRIFRIEHEKFEDAISNFVKLYRENRREVFEITEYVADSEQLRRVFEM